MGTENAGERYKPREKTATFFFELELPDADEEGS